MFTGLMVIIVVLTVLFGVTLGTALFLAKQLTDLRYRSAEKIADLHREKFELNKSWEEGMDDQQESYEMQLLTLQENFNALQLDRDEQVELVQQLNHIVVQHEEWCLPTLKSPFR